MNGDAMDDTTSNIKTYWSRSLNRAVTIPEDDERLRIDALLETTQDLLAAIDLSAVAPADPAAKKVWDNLVATARTAAAAFRQSSATLAERLSGPAFFAGVGSCLAFPRNLRDES